MKKVFFLSFFTLLTVGCFASPVALVYTGKENVMKGRAVMGTVVEGGVVVPADNVLTSKDSLMGGAADGGPLRSATLVRLDLSLNIAFLTLGAEVPAQDLQNQHARNVAAVNGFVPAAPAQASPASSDLAASTAPTGSFLLKINGKALGSEPVVLKKRLKKSKFKLEIANDSPTLVWSVDVELVSDPKLSFWKEGKKTGLNDVPRPKFQYGQQVFFKPLSKEKTIEIPIEVFFIEGEDYIFTFRVSYKQMKHEQQVQVKFK